MHAADRFVFARVPEVTATTVEFRHFGLSVGSDDDSLTFADGRCIEGSLRNLRGETGTCLSVRQGTLWIRGWVLRRWVLCVLVGLVQLHIASLVYDYNPDHCATNLKTAQQKSYRKAPRIKSKDSTVCYLMAQLTS